jgi:hypothetical protein
VVKQFCFQACYMRFLSVTFLLVFIAWGAPVKSDDTIPSLQISMEDGNPWDKITIQNTGCTPLSGVLVFDFTHSAGGIILDTERGGPGTQDPMPVQVYSGPVKLASPVDGATRLTLSIDRLRPGDIAIVRLDFDSTRSWWHRDRVVAMGADLGGTHLRLTLPSGFHASRQVNRVGRGQFGHIQTCPQITPTPKAPSEDSWLTG